MTEIAKSVHAYKFEVLVSKFEILVRKFEIQVSKFAIQISKFDIPCGLRLVSLASLGLGSCLVGMLDHHIDGSHLCSKRSAKLRFRQGILDAWGCHCAYCGSSAATLDHVRPRCGGGHYVASNLVAACAVCNRDKGSALDWTAWYRRKEYWSPDREEVIRGWLQEQVICC